MKVIDGDSHFIEPMDLFERYIDPAFRERTIRLVRDPQAGIATMLCDGKPLKLRDVDQIMGILVGYGEKERGLNIVQFAGDERFFIGSDYPHAEGFVHPVETARKQ